MTGLQALMATGLNLAALDQQPPFPTETLRWHSVAEGVLPDADTTVLMWVLYDDGQDWAAGWWDGSVWRDAASGGEVAGCVAYWCEPQGPQACTDNPAQPLSDRLRAIWDQLDPVDEWRPTIDEAAQEVVRFESLASQLERLAAAPQPVQEPLTWYQRQQMWRDASIDLPSPENCYKRGIQDAERAHGIGAAPTQAAPVAELVEAAQAVLAFRHDTPTTGHLRDNDKSRDALRKLAAALARYEGTK